MSPFIPENELMEVFGKNLLNDNDLIPIMKQLKGEVEVKPFECVGTVKEVNACLRFGQQTSGLENLLNQYDEANNLPKHFEQILKDKLQ